MTNAHCALKENAMKLKLSLIAAGVLAATSMVATTAQAAPAFADVIVLMDESGSMSGEQTWIKNQITTLDTGLVAEGLTPNQYGLIGFGASAAGSPDYLRGFDVGGTGLPNTSTAGSFGTAAQFQTAAGNLVASGGTEDGYAAINLANTLAGRTGAARNYILVTDEDRDNTNSSFTYAGILSSMTGAGILLNAIVNQAFTCGGAAALGVAKDGANTIGFVADGSGGYTQCTGTVAFGSGSGSTKANYVDLALATGGAAWNLNLHRAGGLTADSFTAAFIEWKVEEITNQTPLPGTLALLGIGLVGLGAVRRKQAAVAA
jgi:hypothetical protein